MRKINLAHRGMLAVITMVTAAISVLGAAQPVYAATMGDPAPTIGPAYSGQLGMDISWPQCDTLPVIGTQAFSLIGVTGGTAADTNPCLADQLRWAAQSNGTPTSQPSVSLYVNTGNPGFKNSGKKLPWPTSNTYRGTTVELPSWFTHANHAATCSGHENYGNLACAYMYGWQRAWDDANTRGVSNPGTYRWWLDVERINSWSTNQRANEAVLEGMVAYFTGPTNMGGLDAEVGIYSQMSDWAPIVGNTVDNSNLNGLDIWLPIGHADYSTAVFTASFVPAFIPTSHITMVQFIMNGYDYDYVPGPSSGSTRMLFGFWS